MTDLPHKVFVYGTIQRREINYYLIKQFEESGSLRFIGKATTVHPYPLIIASRYNAPFLLDAKGKGKRVSGEVFAMDDEAISFVDKLEESYLRQDIDVILENADGSNSEPFAAGVYTLTDFKPELLEHTAYASFGIDGEIGGICENPLMPTTEVNDEIVKDVHEKIREDVKLDYHKSHTEV